LVAFEFQRSRSKRCNVLLDFSALNYSILPFGLQPEIQFISCRAAGFQPYLIGRLTDGVFPFGGLA